jgi:type I site-specific restriction endonuclease
MPDLNEARTRASLINPQLEKAGWNLSDRSQIQFEVPVQGYDPTPWNGFTDFSLYHPDGTVLAVIEAKRTARNAREGEEQLRQYVKEIAAKQKAPLCVPKTPSVLICRPNRLTLATMVALIFLFLNQRAVWKQRTRRSDIS